MIISNNLNEFNMGFKASDRLNAHSISKLPINAFSIDEKADHYVPKRKKSKNAFWTKIFTVASFALTGLYLAHRNNLFNPVKREARKILRTTELADRLKGYVADRINPASYDDFTKSLLEKYSADNTRTEGFMFAAKTILGDEEKLTKLLGKVTERLGDDANTARHTDGFVADILEKLGLKIEKLLKTAKKDELPYKNKQSEFIAQLFAPKEGKSIMDDSLFEIFQRRAGSLIEDFVTETKISLKLNAA